MSKWTYSEDVELYNKVDEYGKKWTIIQRCNTMLKHVKRLFIWHYILSYEEVAKKLINKTDSHSRTPLVCACQNGSLECVKALVQFGNVQFISKHRKRSALIDAAANGHADIVQYLIKQKECDITAKNCHKLTGIEAAILNGHIDVVDVLVQNGAVKNYTKNQIGDLFLAACGTFNNEMIEFLDKTFEIPYQTMGDIFMSQAVKI